MHEPNERNLKLYYSNFYTLDGNGLIRIKYPFNILIIFCCIDTENENIFKTVRIHGVAQHECPDFGERKWREVETSGGEGIFPEELHGKAGDRGHLQSS